VAKELAKEPRDFEVAQIPHPVSDSWSILEGRYPEGLEPVAEAIARDGVEVALKDVPIGSFGKFVTVDRGEIEGFRSIRTLMREYDSEPAPRPLNIAVFGPPGAGKSFGVKAVAKSAFDGDKVEDLTFNLSQMRDPAELADALHQVRDVGLQAASCRSCSGTSSTRTSRDESVRLAAPFPGSDAGRRFPAGPDPAPDRQGDLRLRRRHQHEVGRLRGQSHRRFPPRQGAPTSPAVSRATSTSSDRTRAAATRKPIRTTESEGPSCSARC
jgi:hypothetical protein